MNDLDKDESMRIKKKKRYIGKPAAAITKIYN